MKITCPECGFSRDVPEGRLPGENVLATCPKCKTKFRINTESETGREQPEEDIRQIADRAYRHEAERFKTAEMDQTSKSAANNGTWDQVSGSDRYVGAFFTTISRVMFSAPAFFRSLRLQADLWRPLIFYLIITVFQTVVELMWGHFFLSVLAPGASGDPQLEKMLSMLTSQHNIAMTVLLRTSIMVLQLYIFSFLLYLAYKFLAPGRSGFSLLFQIMAYSSAPSILCVVPLLGSLAGFVWSIVCLLAGCKAALGLDWGRTLAGFLPILFFMAPLFIRLLDVVKT